VPEKGQNNKKMKISKGKIITDNKLKLQRGYSYISAFAIPFLVATQLAEILPGTIKPYFPWWVLFILSMAGVWVIGHLDFNTLWKRELEYNLTKNPEWIRQSDEIARLVVEKMGKKEDEKEVKEIIQKNDEI